MKTPIMLSAIILALCLGAGTNDTTNNTTNAPAKVAIPTPDARLDAPERSQMPGRTNSPSALQSTPTTVLDAKTMTWIDWAKDTNAVLALPFVQQAMLHTWTEGAQFGVAASVQNRTLVEMQDAAALMKAATFMRFGQAQGKR